MMTNGTIVRKEFLLNLMAEYPEIDIALYHEHGDFFYYTRDHIVRGPAYFWVDNKHSLEYEEGMVEVNEIYPFEGSYQERCCDCGGMIPKGEVRYRIPHTRCSDCFEEAVRNL